MTPLALFIMASAIGLSQPDVSAELPVDIPIDRMTEIVDNTEIFGRAKWEVAREASPGDTQKNEQSMDVELKSAIGEQVSLKAIVRAVHETELERQDLSDIDLREFYLDIASERAQLRVGRQQVVWGKTDGLRLLDLINPQDFREFILDDFIDSRIPLWMGRADLYIGDDSLQFLLIPDIRSNKLAGPGDRFEPLFLKGIRSSPLPKLEEKGPATNLSNSEFGIRYSGFAKGWDYTVNYFYSWEDNPLYFTETIGGTASIIRRERRSKMAGGSFSKAFGSFVFRGEAAIGFGRYFSTTSASHPEGQAKKDETKVALGLDYSVGEWTVSGQFFETIISDYESGIANDRYTTLASIMINRYFFNETLNVKFLNIFGINESDNLGRLSATYSLTDSWKVTGGVSLFNGPADSFFGQFGDADRVEMELTCSF